LGWGRWLLALLADSVAFVTATALGLSSLGVLGYVGFASMRLLAQVLFGELVVVVGVLAVAHFRSAPPASANRGRGVFFAVGASLLLATYAEAYHHGPYDLQVRRHAVDLTKGRAPAGVLRLVHLSDLQTFAIRPYERRVFAKVAELNPDLLLFTGDYVQSRYRPTRTRASADLRALLAELRLQPRYGIFALQGDVDAEEWQTLFDGLGVTCLANQHARVRLDGGRSLALTGLDLRASRENNPVRLARLLEQAPTADYHLLAGHSPDFVRALGGSAIDLALAGHTHGGQIVIPGFGPPLTLSRLPRRYAGGLHRYSDVPLHVSRGIGMERGLAPQVRFFCPPEICVLEVRY
jgi:predicted MPP superfamily phosphohydrolase